jgi:hypothetical protein
MGQVILNELSLDQDLRLDKISREKALDSVYSQVLPGLLHHKAVSRTRIKAAICVFLGDLTKFT